MKKNKQGDKSNTLNKQPVVNERKTETPVAAISSNRGSFLSNISQEEKISLFLLLCVILLVILIRSNFLSIPFERDEGSYSYYGKLLLQGKIPYKDFYEQKFPGIYYFYGLIIALFGDTVRSLHTGFICLNVATVIAIYYASRTLFNPVAGIISATTFAIVSLTPFLSGFTIQSEHGVAFFNSIGLLFYALFTKKNKWYLCFLMGLAFGIAFMIKTNSVFIVLWGGVILILDFFLDKKKSFKELFTRIGVYSGGVFLFIAILFLIMLAKGSFKEMIFWAYTIPKKYVGKIPFEMGEQMFKYNLNMITQSYMFFWIHSLLIIPICFLKGISSKIKVFGVSLLIFSFFTIVPGFYFYSHYWIQLVPSLALTSGLVFYSIITVLQNKLNVKFNGIKYIYLGIFGLFVFANVSSLKEYYFNPNYEAILRAVYGNNPFPEAWEIGEYINAHSTPKDGLVVVGSEPELYIYTDKNCPSRHAYFSFLVFDVPESGQWQREFARDVEKAKPRYFVFFNHSISLLVQANTDHYVFDWMKQYIDSNYKMVGLVDMIDGQQSVYKWNEQINGYQPVSKNIIYVFERKI